jgi:hypothetical protein
MLRFLIIFTFLQFFLCIGLCKLCFATINIVQISNLNFGDGFVGDPSITIQPGTAEDAQNASFLVTGDPSRAYTIALPGSAVMNHVTSSDTISITNFRSQPINGLIQPNGEQLLFVGATRSALSFGLRTGSYSGVFTVTVVY